MSKLDEFIKSEKAMAEANGRNQKPTVNYLDWLYSQTKMTGDRQIIADFAVAVTKTLAVFSLQFNRSVSIPELWMLMGTYRLENNIQIGFLATYLLYMQDTKQRDYEAEKVVDEILQMVDVMSCGKVSETLNGIMEK